MVQIQIRIPTQELEQIIVPLDEAERILSLQLALKCSDLGHTTASLPVHLKWVSGLEEEVGDGFRGWRRCACLACMCAMR